MFHRKTILLALILVTLITSGCGMFRPKPTEICQNKIEIKDLGPIDEFDKIDFLELAIEVAKDKHFQPPTRYDKARGVEGANGIVVFGRKDWDRMPGIPMIIYLFVRDDSSEEICINAFPYRKNEMMETRIRIIIDEYKEELINQYKQRQEEKKYLLNKYHKKKD